MNTVFNFSSFERVGPPYEEEEEEEEEEERGRRKRKRSEGGEKTAVVNV